MEVIHEIKYDGKTYKVHEPTIDIWQELMVKQEWSTDFELAISILSWVTGLSKEEIRQADTRSIINACDGIIEYFTSQGDDFYESFTLGDRKYKFIDLPNMTFGEYVDIDDILQKPISERYKLLSTLMALLYRELDEDGNYVEYNIENIKENALRFRKLPMKYVKGSTVFFYHMESMLDENTPFYIHQKTWWILQSRLIRRRVKTVLGGIQQYIVSVGKTFLIWTRWLKKVLWRSSTL